MMVFPEVALWLMHTAYDKKFYRGSDLSGLQISEN